MLVKQIYIRGLRIVEHPKNHKMFWICSPSADHFLFQANCRCRFVEFAAVKFTIELLNFRDIQIRCKLQKTDGNIF